MLHPSGDLTGEDDGQKAVGNALERDVGKRKQEDDEVEHEVGVLDGDVEPLIDDHRQRVVTARLFDFI